MKSTEKCYVCGTDGEARQQGKAFCFACYQKVTDKYNQMKLVNNHVNFVGIAAGMMKEYSSPSLLKVYSVPGDLLDALKQRAADECITFRQVVINLFECAVAEMKKEGK